MMCAASCLRVRLGECVVSTLVTLAGRNPDLAARPALCGKSDSRGMACARAIVCKAK
jgi:hypothetical protein